MKDCLISAALCAMLFGTGCRNEEIVKQDASDEFTLTLDMGAGSRTVMGENGCQWGDDESLYVVGDGGKSYGTLNMVWKSADGKSAMFSGKITGNADNLKHMVYPVPNEDGQIPMFTLNGANHNAPMVGSIEGGEVTDLGYVGGLVKIKVNGNVGEKEVTLKAVEGNDADAETSVVAGYYQFNPETGTLEYKQYEESDDKNKTVTVINIPEDGIIYLPVDTDATKENTKTITVSLTIEGQTPVVAQVEVAENGATVSGENSFPVVNYDEEEGVVSSKITSLNELKQALKVGGEYELTDGIETTEILVINKNITFKGNDHSVTSSARYVFEITTGGINVAMNGLNMVNEAVKATGNDKYLAGIKIDPNLEGVGLTLDACSVSFKNENNGSDWAYAVNVAGSTQNCKVTIIGGAYEGANVINVWGTGHGIHIEGATLTSLYKPNEFICGACIRVEDIIEYLETFDNTFNGVNAIHVSVREGKYIGRSTGSGDVINASPVVAKVDGELFNSLEQAATKRGQIEIFGNVTLKSDIVINSSILVKEGREASVDLNGFDITSNSSDVFEVKGTLTIDGNKDSFVKANGDNVCAVWANGGTVVVNGGYYSVVKDRDGKRNDCIYAGYNQDDQKTAGHITINGGYFEYASTYTLDEGEEGYDVDYDGDRHLLNCANKDTESCEIVVNGGFFKNHAPSLESYGTEDEVVLGEGKGVYLMVKGTAVNEKHAGKENIWYEVK